MQIESAKEVSRAELEDLQRDPEVAAAAPEMPLMLIQPREASGGGNPPAGGANPANTGQVTWGVKAVKADTSPFDGSGITVAVLDTGIDATHPAFQGVQLVTQDFTASGSVNDTNGHGTHCAGTIFGRDVNGLRIGVARGVKRALIGKVLGPGGGGSTGLAQAMQWAVQNGASVISMSLGIDFPGFVQRQVARGVPVPAATSMALEAYRQTVFLFERLVGFFNASAAFGQSALVVAATGNESARRAPTPFTINLSPPAASPGILGVAALGQNGAGLEIADFSNTGAMLAAPGVDIASAWPGGGTNSISGTSMATPHVAGVAALWAQRQQSPGPVPPSILQAHLLASCSRAGLANGITPADVGEGLVQAPQS